jgi:hypothetical protein
VADHSFNALVQSYNLKLKSIYAVAQQAIAVPFLFCAALIQRVLCVTGVMQAVPN